MDRDVERNRPQAIGGAFAGDDDGIFLDNFDVKLGEEGDAVVVTKLSK